MKKGSKEVMWLMSLGENSMFALFKSELGKNKIYWSYAVGTSIALINEVAIDEITK